MQREEWRITDGDRHSAIQALGEHYAAGRLDKAEFDERADAAMAARTNLDLEPLFADLTPPARAVPSLPSVPPLAATGPRAFPRPGPRGFPFPLVPVLVLIAVVVLWHGFWLLPLVLVALLVLRGRRHRHWHHAGYSRRW